MELSRIRTLEKRLLRPLLHLPLPLPARSRSFQTLARSPPPPLLFLLRPRHLTPPRRALLRSFASFSPVPVPGPLHCNHDGLPPAPLPPEELASDDDAYYQEQLHEYTQDDHTRLVPVKAYFPCTSINLKSLQSQNQRETKMVLRRAAVESPKKVAALVDLVNLPTALREFFGGRSQMSHLTFFLGVWSHIKNNNLQDPTNRNIVNCDEKLKTVLLGRSKVELSELPMLVKLHFPKVFKA